MTRSVPILAALVIGLTLAPNVAPAQDQTAGPGNLTVDFLDVGQGDSVLIRSPEGKAALIDAGPSKDVVPLLRRRGVTSLDLVAVSHHHADHYGGMDDVIREFRPRYFLATNSSHTTPTYLKLLRLVRDSGMQALSPADTARRIELGSASLTVLPQPPEDRQDENDNSIGIRVGYGTFSVLLTGDSQSKERAFWEASCPGLIQDCTVVKLAHHGSRNGTDARWLALVRPRLAVASVGRGNEFGHPHPQTLALLEARMISLLRTDRDGTVTVVSDGKEWGDFVAGKAPVRDDHVAAAGHKAASGTRSPSRIIDINRASQEELMSLPGVGVVIARRIIEGRPYRRVDDLRRVKGIGEKRLAEIRPYVGVR
jgi:beta-lactamase superfamily II metal-dependent hydrolase